MKVTSTSLVDVKLVEPRVFGDDRGVFFESWNARAFAAAGIEATFVQDNHSQSRRGVLRGLHYQIEQAQGKLVLWVPPGFAHGFLTLSDTAEFLYKTTDYYSPQHERTLLWSDPVLGIEWPNEGAPLLTPKDAAGTPLAAADVYP